MILRSLSPTVHPRKMHTHKARRAKRKRKRGRRPMHGSRMQDFSAAAAQYAAICSNMHHAAFSLHTELQAARPPASLPARPAARRPPPAYTSTSRHEKAVRAYRDGEWS